MVMGEEGVGVFNPSFNEEFDVKEREG